ncbi:unnamed protein product [Hapterophycus canaliculatus]
MREHEKLAARLANLEGPAAPGDQVSATTLEGRLKALVGKRDSPEGAEEELNSRLASLAVEGHNTSSSAEDLNTRLSRLSPCYSMPPETRHQQNQQQRYGVPEDFPDDWQDLDDVLEDALEEGAGGTAAVVPHGKASVGAGEDVDKKLSELDVLLRAEAAACDSSVSAERAMAPSDIALEAFLRGASGAGRVNKATSNGGELGEEEDVLLQMVSDQVRLEGHGLIDRASSLGQKQPRDMWLPLAPTSRPEASSAAAAARKMKHFATGDGDLDATAAARLISQQAMDEARLQCGNNSFDGRTQLSGRGGNAEGKQAATAAHGEGHISGQTGRQQQQPQPQHSSSWCCICSEDATLGCKLCEEESGQDEPEVFCARCFAEVHREDPEMKEHQPQELSRNVGRGKEQADGRKYSRGWRRRK